MQDLSAIEIKYLKKLKRNPNGVTDEEAENIFGKHFEHTLKSLRKNGFVDKMPDKYDRIGLLMQLKEEDMGGFSGEWVLTEKGYAALKENTLLLRRNFIAAVIGYLLGIITAIIPVFVEFLLG